MKNITTGQLSVVRGEPRVFDLHLAANLGMTDTHDIRRLIVRNLPELEMHGTISGMVPEIRSGRGRPGKAYYLNEGQALVVCALSQTPKAAEVRKVLIDVFMAWRLGKTVPVKEHHRRPPSQPTAPRSLTVLMNSDGRMLFDACVPADLGLRMLDVYIAG